MEIECEYNYLGYTSNILSHSLYSCDITSASIKERNQEIKAFIGHHEIRKTDHDVEAIRFYETEVHYMPKGLRKIFPNLKVIEIINCGLKEITRDDLIDLEDIKSIDFSNNELKTLPDDLFEGMTKLKSISFGINKLEFVSSQLLQPVLENKLTWVSFFNNPTISAAFNASRKDPSKFYVDLPVLMKLIDEKCKKPPVVKNQTKPFKEFWTSKRFSDFTISVGNRKFSVHKILLSMQSGYFDEVFLNQNDEDKIKEIKIEDLSAEVVEEVLRWMYTGQIPDVRNANEVFALVMKLKISGLKEIAESLVLKQIDHGNVMEVFELGHRYKSEKIKNLAFEEIKNFLNDLNLDENLKEEPERLMKIFEIKKNYNESIKKAMEN